MKIGITADHRGYKLKEKIKVYLQEKGYEVEDFGTNNFDRIDHPLLAEKLGKKIQSKEIETGIAICGTGIGMSITCNKMDGVYCAKVDSIKEARLAKEHNNCNVIAFRGNMLSLKAKLIVNKFLKTEMLEEEVYKNRLNQVKRIEKRN